MKKHAGFTLVEILVVVLIVGILAAVAVPQYQKAVLKSKFSSLLPTTKAVRDGNEAYYLTHSGYARAVNQLDITTTNNEDMTLELSNDPEYSYVLATRPSLNNNLIMYQKHSAQFPGEIHCEALEDDERANWLCETGMHATKTLGEGITPNYIEYVTEGTGNGLTPAEVDAMNGPNCDKAFAMGATCEITENEDGTKTKLVCSARGICSRYDYNEDGSYKRTTCLLNANNLCVGKMEHNYDANGNKISQRTCSFTDSTTGLCKRYSSGYDYTYDENGNRLSQRYCKTISATTGECTAYNTTYNYDYTYDANGNRLSQRSCRTFDETGACTEYSTSYNYDYTYDANGNQLSERNCNAIDVSSKKCTSYNTMSNNYDYTYDSNGNQTSKRECKTINNDTGVCTEYKSDYRYGYDENGNKISDRACKTRDTNTDQCTEYSTGTANKDYIYDTNGNLIAESSCSGVNVSTGKCTGYYGNYSYNYTYDADGNQTSYRTCSAVDVNTHKCTAYASSYNRDYTYDANGNQTSMRRCTSVDVNTGDCVSYMEGTDYTYDDSGNRTSYTNCKTWDGLTCAEWQNPIYN